MRRCTDSRAEPLIANDIHRTDTSSTIYICYSHNYPPLHTAGIWGSRRGLARGQCPAVQLGAGGGVRRPLCPPRVQHQHCAAGGCAHRQDGRGSLGLLSIPYARVRVIPAVHGVSSAPSVRRRLLCTRVRSTKLYALAVEGAGSPPSSPSSCPTLSAVRQAAALTDRRGSIGLKVFYTCARAQAFCSRVNSRHYCTIECSIGAQRKFI